MYKQQSHVCVGWDIYNATHVCIEVVKLLQLNDATVFLQ